MEKGIAWLKERMRMKKGKQQQSHGSDRSNSDVSNILFDLFHESCVPQWKEVIGSGSFGVSCKGLYKDNRGIVQDVAMKFLNHLSEEEAIEVVQKEMDAFVRLKVGHPNIVQCIGGNMGGEQDWPWEGKVAQIDIDGLHCFKVEELLTKNLRELLHEDKDFADSCTYADLLHIFLGIASGLKHLNEHGITHCDLKPTNVLVDISSKSLKITDFGASRMRVGRALTAQSKGTPGYMAPELFCKKFMACKEDALSTLRLDVYSLGVIMWECLTRCSPDQIDRSIETLGDDLEFVGLGNSFFFMHVMCPPELRKLVASCLDFSMEGPSRRPGIREVKKELQKMQAAPWTVSRPMWMNHLTGTRVVPPCGYIASALSSANLNLDLDINITTNETLGIGPFSRIEAGEYEDSSGTAHDVVVKYFPASVEDQVAKELMLFGHIPQHENLIMCFGSKIGDVESKGKGPFIVLERMACDLDTFLWRRRGSLHFQPGHLDYHKLLARIWIGVASGLQHLHDHGIVYQNLCPTNVLLDFTLAGRMTEVKLGSLLYAEAVKGDRFRVNIVPNVGFMAPEAILSMHSRNQHLTKAMDVFSFGALMMHCLEEGPDGVGDPPMSFGIPKTDVYPPLFFKLVSDCTRANPADRPTCREVAERLGFFLASLV